jgi:hypothetical protein
MCLGGFRLAMIVSVELNADNLTLCAEYFSDKCAALRRINAAKTLRRSGKTGSPKSWTLQLGSKERIPMS